MDPTITTGCIFSLKGSQNHILSNQWKETVSKEQQLHKGWKNKYAKKLVALEETLLEESLEQDKQAATIKAAQPRDPEKTVLYEDGQGRLPFLKQQRRKDPHERHRKPMTASQEIGWRASSQIMLDTVKSEHGHKPIVTASFFRKRGVFS